MSSQDREATDIRIVDADIGEIHILELCALKGRVRK